MIKKVRLVHTTEGKTMMNHHADKLAARLSEVLADTYILYLKCQNFHWNVTGMHFHTFHEMFQQFYEELAEAVDGIAERIRALGAPSSG